MTKNHLSAVLILLLLAGCGGGGGSSSDTSFTGQGEGIRLLSITFPKCVDLEDATANPPADAPLSQQVIFTFSGLVQGEVSASSILIHADPGLYYSGPKVYLNPAKNIVLAKGEFTVLSNLVVFTPNLPKKQVNFSPDADLDELPGLLPDTTYHIFVILESAGSISNLKSIDPSVPNPVSFHTGGIPQLYFKNFPDAAPEVAAIQPQDGRMDFPVNTLEVMSGFKPHEGIQVTFDQPLYPGADNLEGIDENNDGLKEPNLFLRFSDPRVFAASRSQKGMVRFNREYPEQVSGDTFQLFMFEGAEVSISHIAFSYTGEMIGLCNGVLYRIDYREEGPVIELTKLLDTGKPGLIGLASSIERKLYTIDVVENSLVEIDDTTWEFEKKYDLPGADNMKDLACGHDGFLFLLKADESAPGSRSIIEKMRLTDGSIWPVAAPLSGVFESMHFIDSHTLYLFEEETGSLHTLDLDTHSLFMKGALPAPWNTGMDAAMLFYAMETEPVILENTVNRSIVSLMLQGMLPHATVVEIMVRNRLENIGGWDLLDDDELLSSLGSRCAGAFTTYDPGAAPLEDRFIEDFCDNLYESFHFEIGQTAAIWNYVDLDGEPPDFSNLVAPLGAIGSGELGDFVPTGIFEVIILDTDYQVLPLYDGSTPHVKEPIVIKNGLFNFRDIKIPDGVTIGGRGSNPLVFTATGDVEIAGTIDVSGLPGTDEAAFDSGYIPLAGGLGGPGAGRGGMGQPAVPYDFKSLVQLQTPPTGEVGWGPNAEQIGGRGGDSGAHPNVPWKGTTTHKKSRGAGGGGGSMLQPGNRGMKGIGEYVPDENENPVFKKPPVGGLPGNKVFMDDDLGNNFFGSLGEFSELHGGQGGGGAGTRWDSLNPNSHGKQPAGIPVCMYDSKGGGAGGGGGALAIHALGTIRITNTGKLLARGGEGGAGEQIGGANCGGGGGGGGGGVVILHSGKEILLEEDLNPAYVGAVIDVSGGQFGDGKGTTSSVVSDPGITCPLDKDPPPYFCTLSRGDGGEGGFGLIQLMVSEPDNNLHPPPSEIAAACSENRIFVGATIFVPDWDNLSKYNNPQYERVFLTFESDPEAYPKSFAFYSPEVPPPPPEDLLIVECSPLVSPYITAAALSPVSYGVSKWINMTGTMIRSRDHGMLPLPGPNFHGFQGTDPLTGLVLTHNGYVLDYNKPDYNDIEVCAPCLGMNHYIPDENEVGVTFQGAHPAAPGLCVPGDEVSDWTPDPTALSGYPLIRFRVMLNIAKSTNLTLESTRPQVNKVRIRVAY